MQRATLVFILIGTLVISGLLAGCAWFYKSQKQQMRSEAEGTINAVAQLKVDQIAQWQRARLAEAVVLIETPAANIFRRWLADPRPEDAQTILDIFRPQQQHFHYSDISLVDTKGRVMLSLAGPSGRQMEESGRPFLAAALHKRQPVLTVLHRSPDERQPHQDIIAPFFAHDDATGAPLGAVVMRSEVGTFLYSLIQSWPIPTRSAESFLVRRDGDEILILNDLRPKEDADVKLRLPQSQSDLSGLMTALEQKGVVQDLDYRGVEVLAALKRVPGSPWFILAKIDTVEVFASWHTISTLLVGLFLMILTAIAATAGLVCQQRDKTHYRNLLLTEKKLKESQAQWENIFQAIGHPVFILAPDQTILAVNQAWEKLSGRPGKDIVGRKCYEVTHNSPTPPSLCPFAKMRRSKRVETTEIEFEAVHRHFLASYTPVLTEDGSLVKVILIATDITQAKETEAEKTQLEQQLLQAQKMEAVGTLAGGIAHDFNNILSPIIGYTELALRSLDPEQPLAAQLTQILVAGQRAKGLVKQILTFSQQSLAERMPLEIQPIIKETIKLIRSSLPTTIEIRQNIAPDCGTILADPTQIHQILMNLCINAYHAMKQKPTGVLEITLAPLSLNKAEAQATLAGMQPGSYILLEIADTGCGMDLATLAKIFEPYFTTKGKTGGGTGLGLALVHGIMKAYGGYIKVESEPGKGSSFRLYFPMVEKGPIPGESEQKEMPMGNRERILVVDDEPVIMEMERILLEGLGYRVTGFCAPEQAMQAFRNKPDDFALIITDMAMPGMSGLELTKEVKALRPEIPIILCSGFSEWINEENAKKQGISKYLMKPTLTKDLAVAVREGLEGR